MDRPETTLFLLVSVDRKISTGDTDVLGGDSDFPRITGIREGLDQYYKLEKEIDLFSLNSGRVAEKVGANEKTGDVQKTPASFILVDNKPHLNPTGVDHLIKLSKKFYLVTTNSSHPAFERQGEDNLEIIFYDSKIDFADLFSRFKLVYGIERITIQTGGTLNAIFLREKLIDHISLVIAPALIGGRNTSSLIDGESLHSELELINIKALTLKKCEVLKNSYLHIQYDVINDTAISSKSGEA